MIWFKFMKTFAQHLCRFILSIHSFIFLSASHGRLFSGDKQSVWLHHPRLCFCFSAYKCENWQMTFQEVMTNTPSNTFCRGPGKQRLIERFLCIVFFLALLWFDSPVCMLYIVFGLISFPQSLWSGGGSIARGVSSYTSTVKFDRLLRNSAAGTFTKFQSDTITYTSNLAVSILGDIFRVTLYIAV